ncbi:MAG: NAD(P)-dependent methylenetetrahydromethanopterin dehydrogenase [Planctomycetota bacterium]|nr:NAD(P)-dependent methylenetetrahydromethanopterin dehydrogenase [Planctomycetota bacterium]MED5446792.1 NAD(P)-dependent methylenetetrahydromethanopterin dehydrogenase [Planctomycetota bacterium]
MKSILVQFDTDVQPSVFDRVVAVDSGVEQLFAYGGVTPETVESLVHGAIFTRGVHDLSSTAIFVGGSDVAAGEQVFAAVQEAFFGPMRVSVMMDSNGSNTTAAAAVLRARRHVTLAGSVAVVLGGTGPVGQRAAELLALEGASVRVGSRSLERAAATCESIATRVEGAELQPVATGDSDSVAAALAGAATVIAAGATGVQLISAETLAASDLQVAIDLNAVPPLGIEGVEMTDKAVESGGVVRYGAIGVGGTKMKIHTAALKRLFVANDGVLDTEAIYRIGESLEK